MKIAPVAAALVLAVASSVTVAQSASQPADPAPPKEAPKVYHAGGKHDQRQHEAALRARENGSTMEQTEMHAGGRHDEVMHKAAMQAEAKRAAENAAKQ